MILEENMILKRPELAEFFGVKPHTFSTVKEKYLEELKEYCDYELSITPKGNFRSVTVKKIYCDTYYKNYKQDFIDWFNNNDVYAMLGSKAMCSSDMIVSYYCRLNNLPYEGAHWIVDPDGNRVINPAPEFKIWNYLYHLARKFLPAYNKENNYVFSHMKNPNNFNGRCIYGIYLKDELVYVGKANEFKTRRHQHLHEIKKGEGTKLYRELGKESIEDIEIKPLLKIDEEPLLNITKRDIRAMEATIIMLYKPRLNTIGIDKAYDLGTEGAEGDRV